MTRIVILGGGPAGYEAALVASQHEADVVLVEEDSFGGNCVAYDCVPSKTFIASAGVRAGFRGNADMGIDVESHEAVVDLPRVNSRVKDLALAQSADIKATVERAGVRVCEGRGRFRRSDIHSATHDIEITHGDGHTEVVTADVALIATGASPRVLPDAVPDGRRILTWRQLYDLESLPEHLVVVGSGVTGAEFASAYMQLGSEVTLVSSRDRVLPGEDADAAAVLEDVFTRGGMHLLSRSRASSVRRDGDGIVAVLSDGREVRGSHCLMAVGSVPNTSGIGLEEAGVQLAPSGHIRVNRVASTSQPAVYAAGDCTTALPLASVASMQGRTAVFHALGDAVTPLELRNVTSNVFTQPEVATVGWTQRQIEDGIAQGEIYKLPLSQNPRAKMQGLKDGFVKLFARTGSGTVIGGVITAPRASELILPIALAVEHRLTVDQLARAFSVYPSLSGAITEAARAMHIVA
jgi:NAD(P)H dehydrogenase (quinone)